MYHKIFQKIAVVLIMILPLFAGNSCKDEKCGCSGDVLGAFSQSLKLSDLKYSEDGSSCYFVVGATRYNFCNPNAMYETYLKIKEAENPLVILQGNYYWNCTYTYNYSQYQYSYMYSQYVEYDIFIENMEPLLTGK